MSNVMKLSLAVVLALAAAALNAVWLSARKASADVRRRWRGCCRPGQPITR